MRGICGLWWNTLTARFPSPRGVMPSCNGGGGGGGQGEAKVCLHFCERVRAPRGCARELLARGAALELED